MSEEYGKEKRVIGDPDRFTWYPGDGVVEGQEPEDLDAIREAALERARKSRDAAKAKGKTQGDA